jgi:3-oxoadipate enol-lactonase
VRPPPLPPGRRLHLPSGRTTFARIDGPSTGPVVLLLHGWAVTADLNWFGVYPHLDRYRIVAPDHPGHGRASPRSDRSDRFTLSRAADDAIGALDAVGVERAVVVGYSMGGAVAQLAARRYPGRLDGLILCASACRFTTRAVAASAAALAVGAALHRRLPPRAARRTFDAMAERRTARWGLKGWAAQEVQLAHPTSVVEAMADLVRFDSRPWLASVRTPSVVVMTTRDRLVPLHRQHELLAHRPGGRAIEVAGDHVVCTSAPERFGPVVRDAVASLTTERSHR